MISLAILAILTALAAPSFNPLIERWRVRQASEELQSTLHFARSEAIKRGGGVTILRNTNTSGCTLANSDNTLWSCGWVIFTDPNNNGIQEDEEVILQLSSPPNNVSISFTDSEGNALSGHISVDRWGQLSNSSNTNFAFQLTPQGSSQTSNTTALCISNTGHVKKTASGSSTCT